MDITSPPYRAYAQMHYDEENERLVMHGGWRGSEGLSNETWTFDGTTWSLDSSSGPTISNYCAAWDAHQKALVLFGGSSDSQAYLGQTWLWDGANWEQVDTEDEPAARTDCAMAYHEGKKQSILFGGFDASHLDDTWKFFGKRSHYGCAAATTPLACLAVVGLLRRRQRC